MPLDCSSPRASAQSVGQLASTKILPYLCAGPPRYAAGMDSRELTREQCEAIQRGLRQHQRYFRRLLARMKAERFPADDQLRIQVQAIDDKINSLWMHLHYQNCANQTGG